MSKLTQAPNLLNALKQDVIDAWVLTDGKVEFGFQRLPQFRVPFAVIDLLPVTMEPQSVHTVAQLYQFTISGFFPFPDTGNILLAKIAKADALIDAILTGPNYEGLAYLPIVTEVNFEESDPESEEVFEVHVLFQCQVTEEAWTGAGG